MDRMRLLAAVLLVGCYAPTPQVGLPCTAEGDCPKGQSCDPVALVCLTPGTCAPPYESCDGVCLDTTNDPFHCGACDIACPSDQVCGESECSDQCPPGAPDQCGQSCVDTATDVDHCGSCDEACGDGEICVAGGCYLGEVGLTSAAQIDYDTWHTVTLSGTYRKPVVIMGPPTIGDPDALAVRVRNVTSSSFDFQLSEWESIGDSGHGAETLAFLVIEAGTHIFGDSILMAGISTVTSSATLTEATAVTFPTPLQATGASLLLLSQLVSTNTPAPTVDPTGDARVLHARTFGTTETGFSVQVQAEEAAMYSLDGATGACSIAKGRAFSDESLAWVVIQGDLVSAPCERIAGTYLNTNPGSKVEQAPVAITFASTYATVPAVLANMQTFNGGDQATLRTDLLKESSVNLRVREDITCDAEYEHADEDLAGIACAPGLLASP